MLALLGRNNVEYVIETIRRIFIVIIILFCVLIYKLKVHSCYGSEGKQLLDEYKSSVAGFLDKSKYK